MPKQLLEVANFSGGLNCYSDARDIEDNQFAQNWNAVVDKAGIIRVSGMGQQYIDTDYHDSTNFQRGYGLFQFSTDYSFTEVDGNFNTGIKTGTISATANIGATTCNLEASYTADTDEFNNMSLFIYSGPGIGQSRKITATASGTSAQLTIATALDVALTSSSKYIIYRWTVDGTNWSGDVGGTITASEDFITNGKASANGYYGALSTVDDGYYIYSKKTASDNTSTNLGSIQYTPGLTIKPGVKYYLTFDCAAKQKWTNAVSDGNEDGSATTNYGDKVPWVQLYSDDVADSSGCVRTFTPESVDGWTNGATYSRVVQSSTSGLGVGAMFDISVNGSGVPTFTLSFEKGVRYAVDDTITIAEPADGSSADCDLTLTEVNREGLSLYKNNWISKLDQAGYISLVDENHVDNGDFADDYVDSWSTSGSNITFSSPIQDTGIIVNVGGGVSSTHTGTIAVDGEDATSSNILNRHVYNSSGRFVGICTAVSSTTSITFGGGTVIALSDDEHLYTISSNGYDGVAGTLKMVSNSSFVSVPSPGTYIYQRLTLDDLTPYHLNFLYDSTEGVQFAVYDHTNSKYLVNWTNLAPTRAIGGSISYRFAGAEYDTTYSDSDNRYTLNYIDFFVPKKASGSETEVEIRLSNSKEASTAFVHGVTVHKAHNDLVTMSHQEYATTNPFSVDIQDWSNYYLSFTVPSEYSEVSDWVLKLHAGQYGYRTDANTLGVTDTQEVYFDNMKLSSQDGDTVTLLSNNSSRYSDIALYSDKSKTWDTSFIRWGDPKAKPVYNYVNGMLKISDANFATSNNNYLMYFMNKDINYSNGGVGWIKKGQDIIPNAPSVKMISVITDTESSDIYDAVPYLNALYENEFYGNTNWKMDAFGSGREKDFNNPYYSTPAARHHGLIIRHIQDNTDGDTILLGVNNGIELETKWPFSEKNLFSTDSVFFSDNIDPGNNPWSDSQTEKPKDICVTKKGWPDTNGYNFTANTSQDGYNMAYSRNPIQFIIIGNDNLSTNVERTNFCMANSVSPLSNTIKEIRLKFRYQCSMRSRPSHNSHLPPKFNIQVGVPLGTPLSHTIDGFDAIYVDDVVHWVGQKAWNANSHIGLMCNASTEPFSGWSNNDLSLYHEEEIDEVLSYDVFPGDKPSDDSGETYAHKIEFDIKINLQGLNGGAGVTKNDNLLVTIKEVFNNEHMDECFRVTAVNDDSYSARRLGGPSYYHCYLPEGEDSSWDNSHPNTAMHTEIKIDDIDLTFLNDNYQNQNTDIAISSGKETQVNFTFNEPDGVTSTGWGGRAFKIASSSVNIFDEESSLRESGSILGVDNQGEKFINIGHSPSISIHIGNAQIQDYHISKTKFYMRDTETDIFYLQFYVDHKTKRLYSTTSGKYTIGHYNNNKNVYTWELDRENLKDFNEVNSYESETMVSQDDASSNSSLTCRYKTSVVANNRMYVGNIMQKGVIHGDRMLKSPIGKYNILPASSFVDVAINDGDEITALSYYKDKILQFKKRKVFVINVSGDYEFLEDTFENVGIKDSCAVVQTPFGVAWVNETGCYLYDGEKLTNLIEGVIPATEDYATITNNYWLTGATLASTEDIPLIGYIENRDSLVIKWTNQSHEENTIPSGVTYHFPTKSWSYSIRAWSGATQEPTTGEISNFITDKNGDVLYYRKLASGDAYGTILGGIKKWNQSATVTDTSSAKLFYFTTKDFTFGNINARKKVYKVYVTYKSDGDSAIAVKAAVNGTGAFDSTFLATSTFIGTAIACYGSQTLDTTGDIWKTAELKFSTSSEVNNIYTLQLQFSSAAAIASFEINDISISFRTKSIK